MRCQLTEVPHVTVLQAADSDRGDVAGHADVAHSTFSSPELPTSFSGIALPASHCLSLYPAQIVPCNQAAVCTAQSNHV